MGYDIPQSISQGSLRAQDEENRRIREFSDKLHSLCRVYEAQCGVGEQNVTHFEIEQRVAEKYAKEHNMKIKFTSALADPKGVKSFLNELISDYIKTIDPEYNGDIAENKKEKTSHVKLVPIPKTKKEKKKWC